MGLLLNSSIYFLEGTFEMKNMNVTNSNRAQKASGKPVVTAIIGRHDWSNPTEVSSQS